MLTRDRPQMAARALAAFRAQTYPETHRALFILDNGPKSTPGLPYGERLVASIWVPDQAGKTIGSLRNGAIRSALGWRNFDVVVTMDDDDLSHPWRIAEQVALLQSSGADCVGYNEVLFWRHTLAHDGRDTGVRLMIDDIPVEPIRTVLWEGPGEAWLYSNRSPAYCTGASLCYWRKTWERHPFPDAQVGEDNAFLQSIRDAGGKVVGVSGKSWPPSYVEPRLIQSIHGGNTAAMIDPKSDQWRRAPEWDAYARERMAL
jgi:hypothetical protein